jgi:hypothetical protein
MPTVTVKEIVELIAALTMPCGVIGILINRKQRIKAGTGVGGISARSIQFASVAMFFPAIIILGLENKIGAETAAALLGGAVGYLLSGLSNYDLAQLIEKLRRGDDKTIADD